MVKYRVSQSVSITQQSFDHAVAGPSCDKSYPPMAPVPAAASAQQRIAPVPVDSASSPIWLTAGPAHLDVATRPMRLPPRAPCDRDRLPRVDPSSPAYHGPPPVLARHSKENRCAFGSINTDSNKVSIFQLEVIFAFGGVHGFFTPIQKLQVRARFGVLNNACCAFYGDHHIA